MDLRPAVHATVHLRISLAEDDGATNAVGLAPAQVSMHARTIRAPGMGQAKYVCSLAALSTISASAFGTVAAPSGRKP